MSNSQSTEIGWIITKPNHDDYPEPLDLFKQIAKDQPHCDHEGYQIPGTENNFEAIGPEGLQLETHPHTIERVFISWANAEHGMDLVQEPLSLDGPVRAFITKYDPEAIVTWGIIVTER